MSLSKFKVIIRFCTKHFTFHRITGERKCYSVATQSTNCNISKKTFLFLKTCKSINPRIIIHSKDILAQAQKYNIMSVI